MPHDLGTATTLKTTSILGFDGRSTRPTGTQSLPSSVSGIVTGDPLQVEHPTRQHAAQKTPKALRYWLQEKIPTTRRQEVDNNTSDDPETSLRTCNQRLMCREKFAHVLFVIFVHNVESEHCLLRVKVATEAAHCKFVRSACQVVLVVTLCLSGRCVAHQSQLCVTRRRFHSSPLSSPFLSKPHGVVCCVPWSRPVRLVVSFGV